MRMITWTCDIKVTHSFTCDELREKLETGDVIIVLQWNRCCLQCLDTVGWVAGRASGL